MFNDFDDNLGLPCIIDCDPSAGGGWGGWSNPGGSNPNYSPGGTFTQPPPFTGYNGGQGTVGVGNTTTQPPANTTTPLPPQGTAAAPAPAGPTILTMQPQGGIDSKTLFIAGGLVLAAILISK